MSDGPDAVSICRLHDSPMFRLVRDVMIGGKVRPAGFEFCRYCTDGLVRCPNCGFAGSAISFTVAGILNGNGSIHDELTCIKTGCEECTLGPATTGVRFNGPTIPSSGAQGRVSDIPSPPAAITYPIG